MKKNVKNVAYIQDFNLLKNAQIKKYMGDVKNLTEEDPIKVYKFIVCCNNCYKITNFCLNLNSGTLKDLNVLIKNNKKLDKCIFIATRSNANSVRETITKNIYFSLSEISILISNYSEIKPYNVMTIVSDTRTPYFDQIYETGPKPSYRISELTVEKMNDFVDNGNALSILVALRNFPTNEFEKLNSILLDPQSRYQNFAAFIELDEVDIAFVDKLKVKLAYISTIASNVSFLGVSNAYPDINSITLYDNCAIQYVNFYNEWNKYIKNFNVFNRFNVTNVNTKAIKKKQFLVTTNANEPAG
jgi:hypothetical protein